MAQEDELQAAPQPQEGGPAQEAAAGTPEPGTPAQAATVALADAGVPEAPEEPTGEPRAEEPLFSATYDTTLELLTHYVELLVGKKQKTFALVVAFADVILAAVVAFASPSAWPLAVVLVCVGFGMLWYRGNAARVNAKKIMARLDPADAHRTVNVYEGRVELVRASGDAYEYAVSELSSVTADDSLVVLAFEREGVTVPAQGMTRGTFAELVSWANAKAPAPGAPKALAGGR